jgi:hypothetical protein
MTTEGIVFLSTNGDNKAVITTMAMASEPALDATTAALNLASPAVPLCAKPPPPPPVLNPDLVAPDSNGDWRRARPMRKKQDRASATLDL